MILPPTTQSKKKRPKLRIISSNKFPNDPRRSPTKIICSSKSDQNPMKKNMEPKAEANHLQWKITAEYGRLLLNECPHKPWTGETHHSTACFDNLRFAEQCRITTDVERWLKLAQLSDPDKFKDFKNCQISYRNFCLKSRASTVTLVA